MLGINDIKVGMRVDPKDLDEIYYTLIILSDFKENTGVIVYIGEPNTVEATNIYTNLDGICTVYNNNDEEVSWDE